MCSKKVVELIERATLMLAMVSVCLMWPAMGDEAPFNVHSVTLKEELSIEEVMKGFGVQKLEPWRGVPPDLAVELSAGFVATHLAEAKDKAEPKTILDEFSVNDLLQLNECRKDACSKDGINGRKAVCDKLVAMKAKFVKDSSSPRRQSSKYSLTVYSNLVDYCTYNNGICNSWCDIQKNRFADEALEPISWLAKRRVKLFRSDVSQQTRKQAAKGGPIDYDKAIEQAFALKSKSDRASLRSVCNVVTATLSTIYQFEVLPLKVQPDKDMRWTLAYKYCRRVNELEEPTV